MNRVRKYNNEYQVLITPYQRFNAGQEYMLGNWSDAQLKGFRVNKYKLWEDAMEVAFQLPDINWDQMVLFHRDIFRRLYDVIKYEIDVNNFDVEFEPKILNSFQLKEVMFNRVIAFGERFRLGYQMNDVISYHIMNPYTSNIRELSEILSVNQALRIIYKTNDKGIIRLVGKTDIGTTYEIVLWTSLTAQWAKWSFRNQELPNEIKMKQLEKIIKEQEKVDNGIHLR